MGATKKGKIDFSGVWPALVTPFIEDGNKIDYSSMAGLIEHSIAGGVSGVVVAGSTGEAQTLEDAEYYCLIAAVLEMVQGRVPCIAGVGTNSTARAVATVKKLEQTTSIDGVMLVVPPYNKPTQEGILAHYRQVRAASALPIMAYNIPGRTGVNFLPETVARAAEEGLFEAIKEASGSVDQVLDLLHLLKGKIAVLSGEDSLTQVLMAAGATGVVSVVGNVIPRELCTLVNLMKQGQVAAAAAKQLEVLPLIRAMFVETNPIPVKEALAIIGLVKDPVLRLPLLRAKPSTVELLKRLL